MDFALFFTFLAACGAAAATGALFSPGDWYRGLRKPVWTPPDWLFPVAWTTMYLCMSAAAARVAVLPDAGQALALWSVQIAFNALWTPVFFGLKRMGAGLVVVLCLNVDRVRTGLGHRGFGAECDRVADEPRSPWLSGDSPRFRACPASTLPAVARGQPAWI